MIMHDLTSNNQDHTYTSTFVSAADAFDCDPFVSSKELTKSESAERLSKPFQELEQLLSRRRILACFPLSTSTGSR